MRLFVSICVAVLTLGLANVASAATVSERLSSGGGGAYSINVVFDDVTGEIQQLVWTVNSGTLTVTIHNPPRPDVTRTLTTSGSLNVPAGQYFLTKSARGDWRWTGSISYTDTWTP